MSNKISEGDLVSFDNEDKTSYGVVTKTEFAFNDRSFMYVYFANILSEDEQIQKIKASKVKIIERRVS